MINEGIDMKVMEKMGFEFYKKEESECDKYISIPKQFYKCPFYKKYLNSTTRELYAWLKDRMSLSEYNAKNGNTNFVDDDGYIYLIFTREEVGQVLGLSKQTVSNAFKRLCQLGLIYEKRLGQGYANRIYIGKIKYLSEDDALKLIDIFENNDIENIHEDLLIDGNNKSKNNKYKNSTTDSIGDIRQVVKKIGGINTDITKTDFSDTNLVVVGGNAKDDTYLKSLFEANICQLKKSTSENFYTYCKNYNYDFIKAIIEYCAEINIYSFAGFKKTIDRYINENILDVESLQQSIDQYRSAKKTYVKKCKTKKDDSWTNCQPTYLKYNNISEMEKALLSHLYS